MGYYTRYSLTAQAETGRVSPKTRLEAHETIATLRGECKEAAYALSSNGDSQDSTKWYDHEKHMKEFSAKHPKVLYILQGEGEESGDIWKKYFLNGKMQLASAKITFEPFDRKKLT